MNRTQKLKEYLLRNPTAPTTEVARVCGVSNSYVSVVRQRLGLALNKQGIPQINLRPAFKKQKATLAWLIHTTPDGVDLAAHIVSILTDAMLDEVEDG